MNAANDFERRFGPNGLKEVLPADYLWQNLPTVLLLPREVQSTLAAALACRADQVEFADAACGPKILHLAAAPRLALAQRLRSWSEIVDRISRATRLSMRSAIAELVPAATGFS